MDRTKAIIALLASPSDGEVLAAVAALRRLAAAKNLRIEEFLSVFVPTTLRARPDYRVRWAYEKEYHTAPENDWTALRTKVHEVLKSCGALASRDLTSWEISFFASILDAKFLTMKQLAMLKRIAFKLGVPN